MALSGEVLIREDFDASAEVLFDGKAKPDCVRFLARACGKATRIKAHVEDGWIVKAESAESRG